MIRLAKPYFLVMLVQAVCLLVGLWIHHVYVVSTGRMEAEKRVWNRLVEWSHDWIPQVRHWEADSGGSPLIEAAQAERLANSTDRPADTEFLFVDADWRIVPPVPAGDPEAAAPLWQPGDFLQWQRLEASAAQGGTRGLLETAGGRRLGMAYRLPDGSGFVIGYRSADLPAMDPQTVLASLPAAGVVAFLWTCGLQCIVAYLILSRAHVEKDLRQQQADQSLLKSNRALLRTRDAVIFGLAKLAESRDPETGHHLERISLYSTRLATALRARQRDRRRVTPAFVRSIGISSALHDIGKVGVADSILLKPEGLSEEERLQMQEHTLIGADCIREIERRLGGSNFLQMAREIALSHHERWDGTGYPVGLAGEEIPLAARIVAVADVYDALSKRRVYKKAWSHEDCVAAIRRETGRHFDPEIVEAFLEVEQQFREIAWQFAESDRDRVKPAQEQLLTPEQEQTLLKVLTPDSESEEQETLVEAAS